MKVEVRIKHDDDGSLLIISIDGKSVFTASDYDYEDCTLSRNFSDCWQIPTLLKLAHEAGQRGEEFVLEEVTEDEG